MMLSTYRENRASRLELIFFFAIAVLLGCGESVDVAPQQFERVDALIATINANIEADEGLIHIAEIDHARLAAKVGSPLAPTRVVIYSDPELEAALFAVNPLTALDMPLRLLAYAPAETGDARVIFNSFDYLVSRYGLNAETADPLRERYESGIARALEGVPQAAVNRFPTDVMEPDGITTLASPFDYEETLARVGAAIDAQEDTMHFGAVAFPSAQGRPGAELLLFGAPGPGAKAMRNAQTLGLDGFCQKFLVWQDETGHAFLSFNDMLALATRQGAGKSIPLRVIDYRLTSVFENALSQ